MTFKIGNRVVTGPFFDELDAINPYWSYLRGRVEHIIQRDHTPTLYCVRLDKRGSMLLTFEQELKPIPRGRPRKEDN